MSNLSIIGTENIANLYVSRISLNDSHPMNPKGGVNGIVEFKWYNMLQKESKPVFDYFTSARSTLEIVIVEIYNKNVLRDVMNARSMTERGVIFKRAEEKKLVKTITMGVSKTNPKISDLRKDSLTAGYAKHKFMTEGSLDNFYIYAYFRIKKRKSVNSGPAVIEKIIEDGEVSRDSFVYKIKGSNRIWTGPIHSHDGQAMAGSFHMSRPHPTLEKVNNLNFKLKDYRKPTEFVEIKGSIDDRQISNVNFFSQIRHCQTENKKLNFMFSINIKEMIMKSSKYSAALRKYNKRVFDSLLPLVSVKEITIVMKNTDGRTRPIATSRQRGEKVRTVYSYVDTLTKNTKESFIPRGEENLFSILQEVAFTKESDVRTFRCQVNEREVSTIKVIVELNDPFENYLYSLLTELKNNKKNLDTYDFLLRKRDAFDRETKRFDERYLADAYDGELQYWYRPIETYLKILKLTKRISSQDLADETERMFSYMAPRSCEPDSVIHFMKKYKECMSNFVSKYGLRYSNQLSSNGSGKSSPNVRSNKFIIEYDIYHDYSKKAYSSVERGDEFHQVPLLTTGRLQQLMNLERVKFNNPQIVYSPDQVAAKAAIISSANSGLYDNFYLSPTRLYNLTSTFEFDNIKTIIEDKLAEFNNKSILDSLNIKSLFGKSVSVEVYEEDENIDRVPNVLGDSSDFQSTGSVFQRQTNRLAVPKNILKGFGRQGNKTFKMLHKLNINTPDNIFSSKTEQEAQRIPMQIKFLTQKTQVESIFETTQKLLNDKPHIKDLAFFNLFKIVYESGYETDSAGEIVIGKPIISEMDLDTLETLSSPVICHLVPYEENSLPNVENSFEDYILANNFFVLTPNDYKLVKENSQMIEEHTPTLSNMYRKYTSSSLFETEFLRTYDTLEPVERKEQIRLHSLVKQEKPRRNRSRLSHKKTETPKESRRNLRKNKYAKNEEKIEIMVRKTVTEDNKTVEQLMRKKTDKKRQERMETKKTDQREVKREQEKSNRQESRQERRQNRRNNNRSNSQRSQRNNQRPAQQEVRNTQSSRRTGGRTGNRSGNRSGGRTGSRSGNRAGGRRGGGRSGY